MKHRYTVYEENPKGGWLVVATMKTLAAAENMVAALFGLGVKARIEVTA